MSYQEKLTNLITEINKVTEVNDTNLTDCINRLIKERDSLIENIVSLTEEVYQKDLEGMN